MNAKLSIGLSRTGIALLRHSGWLRRRSEVLAQVPLTEQGIASPESLSAHLDRALADAKCAALSTSIILDNAWAHLFMVTPPQNTTRWHDCRAAANMRFEVLYGAASTEWQIEADWDLQHPFLACALPRTLMTSLRTAAHKHRLRLVAVTPQFVAAWNQWRFVLQPASWFGVAHAGTMMIAATDHRRLCAVRTLSITTDDRRDNQWLSDQFTREALRLNLPEPRQIQLCGDVPGHWVNQTMGALVITRLDADQDTLREQSMSLAGQLAWTGGRR